MGLLHQIEEWSGSHQPKWLVALRAGLGLCLFIKGIQFIHNSILLEQIIAGNSMLSNFSWIGTIIPMLHILGGAMILAGLFTRLACLIHIPILLGAVFFVHSKQGFFSGGSDLPFSVIILLLLIFFLVEGAGPLSLDNAFRNKKELVN